MVQKLGMTQRASGMCAVGLGKRGLKTHTGFQP